MNDTGKIYKYWKRARKIIIAFTEKIDHRGFAKKIAVVANEKSANEKTHIKNLILNNLLLYWNENDKNMKDMRNYLNFGLFCKQ